MMRKSLLVFALLAIVSFGVNITEARGGWWGPRCCYYAASPCYCCTPAWSWTCCDPCCDWSCCYDRYSSWRCCYGVPGQAASDCAACAPAAASPHETNLTPIPERDAPPQNQ